MITEAKKPVHGRTRIALLGCGNVGTEVAKQLLQWDRDVELVGILVRDAARKRGVPQELITADPEQIYQRRPQLVIECIGGLNPAHTLVRRALEGSISVVTANKTLIAHHGRELARVARCSGARLAYEASVCAGVPVLGALRRLRGDRVLRIQGVLNGTCNAILTRMESGQSLAQALAEAQQFGLAEADPTADLSGRDTVEKLCILAAAAGVSSTLKPADVACEGIDRITTEDLVEARLSRRVVRLVAEIDSQTGLARVGPALVPKDHAFATLRGPENAVVITTELAGEIVFKGLGAGPNPTASAVLSDVERLLRTPDRHGLSSKHRRQPVGRGRIETARAAGEQEVATLQHYIRVLGEHVDADPVLTSLARHGADACDVVLSRRRASAVVALSEPAARACARELAGSGGESLVMPLLV